MGFDLIKKVRRVKVVKEPDKVYGMDEQNSKYIIDTKDQVGLEDGQIINVKLKEIREFGTKRPVPYKIWSVVDSSQFTIEDYVIIQKDNTPNISLGLVCNKDGARIVFEILTGNCYSYSEEKNCIEQLLKNNISEVERVSLAFTEIDPFFTKLKKEFKIVKIEKDKK